MLIPIMGDARGAIPYCTSRAIIPINANVGKIII